MSIVNAEIFSELSEFPVERRFDLNIEIAKLKEKLEPITGANHKTMVVNLSMAGKDIAVLEDPSKKLSDYLKDVNLNERIEIKLHVKDEQSKDLLSGDVPKYTISEEKYAERNNSARHFIKELKKKNDTSN